MAVSKQKKGEILEKVKGILGSAKTIAFANFHGLSVAKVTELRRKLRAEGVGYFVAKKSLIKKALESAGFSGEAPSLEGEVALAFGDDLIAPAREVFGFEQKFEKAVSLLGGIFEGVFKNKEDMRVIASIPPRKTLEAQFVNLINSPIQGFVMVLDGIAKNKITN